jgi:hypothetical protein
MLFSVFVSQCANFSPPQSFPSQVTSLQPRPPEPAQEAQHMASLPQSAPSTGSSQEDGPLIGQDWTLSPPLEREGPPLATQTGCEVCVQEEITFH